MASGRTFALEDGFEDLNGASFALPTGKTYDVADALKKGNGQIEAQDEVEANYLAGVHGLKETTAKPKAFDAKRSEQRFGKEPAKDEQKESN